mmetsp:Transcript_2669/g.6772  ORF Transcript_2669/g.6772 Transcript_2669/m.6772 type:complete len:217 (+) Transcript_2669:488-1138(+)
MATAPRNPPSRTGASSWTPATISSGRSAARGTKRCAASVTAWTASSLARRVVLRSAMRWTPRCSGPFRIAPRSSRLSVRTENMATTRFESSAMSYGTLSKAKHRRARNSRKRCASKSQRAARWPRHPKARGEPKQWTSGSSWLSCGRRSPASSATAPPWARRRRTHTRSCSISSRRRPPTGRLRRAGSSAACRSSRPRRLRHIRNTDRRMPRSTGA